MNSASLSLRDTLLALAVVFVWGTNFAISRIGLDTIPPLLFGALRFTFVLLPAVFFLPRPQVAWSNMVLYGVAIGFGQFGLLYIAMDGMISPGLASLVVQMQVFFTIGISMWRSGERLGGHQIIAFALALAGMAVIAAHNGPHDGHGTTALGLGLTLGAALGWAIGNQTAREAGKITNMLAYVVWTSMFSLPPLYLLSFLHEGLPAIEASLSSATWITWAVVFWQSIGNAMFGYGCWAWLLSRYPAATVSPLSLLVPVFGFATSALLLGEPLQPWKLGATALVITGLAINLLWRRTPAAVP